MKKMIAMTLLHIGFICAMDPESSQELELDKSIRLSIWDTGDNGDVKDGIMIMHGAGNSVSVYLIEGMDQELTAAPTIPELGDYEFVYNRFTKSPIYDQVKPHAKLFCMLNLDDLGTKTYSMRDGTKLKLRLEKHDHQKRPLSTVHGTKWGSLVVDRYKSVAVSDDARDEEYFPCTADWDLH